MSLQAILDSAVRCIALTKVCVAILALFFIAFMFAGFGFIFSPSTPFDAPTGYIILAFASFQAGLLGILCNNIINKS